MNLLRQKRVFHDAEFDIERVDVFSIERIGEVTVIGYTWDGVREWELNCDLEKHSQLVSRFRVKLNAGRRSDRIVT